MCSKTHLLVIGCPMPVYNWIPSTFFIGKHQIWSISLLAIQKMSNWTCVYSGWSTSHNAANVHNMRRGLGDLLSALRISILHRSIIRLLLSQLHITPRMVGISLYDLKFFTSIVYVSWQIIFTKYLFQIFVFYQVYYTFLSDNSLYHIILFSKTHDLMMLSNCNLTFFEIGFLRQEFITIARF